MCGIVGYIDRSSYKNTADLHATVLQMADSLVHRGPDEGGSWVDAAAGVAIAHRRLAIIDLSPSGSQPMLCASGRYCIAFNGEIYNFKTLRRELELLGHRFRGGSDTEVILEGVTQWGFDGCIAKLNGMFALALWDVTEKVLHLARDRFGEKPLYYGWAGTTFLFGSELKALRIHPDFDNPLNRAIVPFYLRYSYIPAPHTIHCNIFKLLPGSLLAVDARISTCTIPTPVRYWSSKPVAMDGATNRFEGTESDATEELDARLREAVKLRMEADVPLGALLSGGVDSSTIVALMQAQSHRRVKTFTIGFDDSQYNEAHHAKAVAEYLGTEHTELRVSQREMLAVVPYLPTIYDEPFGDSSQIPTYLVSAIARRAVVVGLTGDGADELFAGYDVYPRLRSLWNVRRAIPDWLAASASDLAGVMCDWTRLTALRRGTDRWPLVGSVAIGRTLRRLSQFLASPTPEAIHRDLRAHAGAEHLAAASTEPATAFSDVDEWLDLRDPVERAMHLDVISYLPDDILVKVDRASMAVSLEARAPFLDHTLAEFVWRLPMSMKRRGPSGKRILRLVLAKYVPGRLVERPKMGFVAPLHSWLRGPLKEWAAELLSEARLDSYGLFDTAAILRTWADYLGGNDIWQSYLWNVLMFQAWMECDEARRASKVSGSASLVAANLLASPCIKD